MRQPPTPIEPDAFSGSRMGTAFIWGFWFMIGAGVASFVLGVVYAVIWLLFVAAVLGLD